MNIFSVKSILIACYLTFFVQFYSLSRDYLRFQTSTRVTYHVNVVIPVPASTICIPALAPMLDMHLKAFKNKSGYFERGYNKHGSWTKLGLGKKCKGFSEKYSGVTNPPDMSDSDKAQLGCLLHYYDNPSARQYFNSGLFEKYF